MKTLIKEIIFNKEKNLIEIEDTIELVNLKAEFLNSTENLSMIEENELLSKTDNKTIELKQQFIIVQDDITLLKSILELSVEDYEKAKTQIIQIIDRLK